MSVLSSRKILTQGASLFITDNTTAEQRYAAYEFIKYAGKHDNLLVKILAAPGLWMQRLTTKEPDDDMIEVGIAALEAVLPENEGEDRW